MALCDRAFVRSCLFRVRGIAPFSRISVIPTLHDLSLLGTRRESAPAHTYLDVVFFSRDVLHMELKPHAIDLFFAALPPLSLSAPPRPGPPATSSPRLATRAPLAHDTRLSTIYNLRNLSQYNVDVRA